MRSFGGMFEVEMDGQLLFSKKALGRFPVDGEVVNIVLSMQSGKSLDEARRQAAAGVEPPPSFAFWLQKFFSQRLMRN